MDELIIELSSSSSQEEAERAYKKTLDDLLGEDVGSVFWNEVSISSPGNFAELLFKLAYEIGTNGYPSITGPVLKKFRTSLRVGCGPTITTARIWPWAVSPQSGIWPWLHNRSTFRFSGNRGDYQSYAIQSCAPYANGRAAGIERRFRFLASGARRFPKRNCSP